MILVDTSVWIDLFNRRITTHTHRLKDLIARDEVLLGDLVLTELLQGIRTDHDFVQARVRLSVFRVLPIAGELVAQRAAENFRLLRAKGITVRKTIGTLIATRCIEDGLALLYSDRDFDPFVKHLGLRSALHDA